MPGGPWLQHLAKFRADNPHLKGNIMQAARATYKHEPAYPENLTEFLTTEVLGNVVEKYCANTKIREQAQKLKESIDNVLKDKENLETIRDILCDYMDFGIFSSQEGGVLLLNFISENEYEIIKKLLKAYHADGGTKYSKDLKYDEE